MDTVIAATPVLLIGSGLFLEFLLVIFCLVEAVSPDMAQSKFTKIFDRLMFGGLGLMVLGAVGFELQRWSLI